MDGFGIYFGSKQFDTISCHPDLSFLTPQIQHPTGNLISDTLNWIPVQGTFTAVGSEVYMVLGNFKTDVMTNTISLLSNSMTLPFTDVCIDDASCIPIDLPASAGPDKTCIPGDSVFIGRTPDVGLNEFCTWYKWPDLSTPIATVAGLYVKPVTTTTYIVRQQLWCSGVRWDTVVVYQDMVGIEKLRFIENELKIFPNPAIDFLEIRFPATESEMKIISVAIFNTVGKEYMRVSSAENEINKISLKDLSPGVYFVRCKLSNGYEVRKAVSIQR